jgi:NAD(P)-dependent dehydrogenase (short-subunit alcohol dehydrogenase family)
LGLALADQFLRAGANVAIAARDPGELAKAKLQLMMLTRGTAQIVLDPARHVTATERFDCQHCIDRRPGRSPTHAALYGE